MRLLMGFAIALSLLADAAYAGPTVADPGEVLPVRTLKRAGARLEFDRRGNHDRVVSLQWERDGRASFDDRLLLLAARLPHLRELWLEQSDVTDAGLIALESLPRLETLALRCRYIPDQPAKITDAGMRHLAGLRRLRVLRLDDSDVTDRGLVHLRHLRRLEDLDLFGTEISDAGLVHLRGLKRLQFLGLAETQWETKRGAISAAAARALQEHLPGCDIAY